MSQNDTINWRSLLSAMGIVILFTTGITFWFYGEEIKNTSVQQLWLSLINFFILVIKGITLKFFLLKGGQFIFKYFGVWVLVLCIVWITPLHEYLKKTIKYLQQKQKIIKRYWRRYMRWKNKKPLYIQIIIWISISGALIGLVSLTFLSLLIILTNPPRLILRYVSNIGRSIVNIVRGMGITQFFGRFVFLVKIFEYPINQTIRYINDISKKLPKIPDLHVRKLLKKYKRFRNKSLIRAKKHGKKIFRRKSP